MRRISLILLVLVIGCGWRVFNETTFQKDFITKHGLIIDIGLKNKPTTREIEEWTVETVNYWQKYYDIKKCAYEVFPYVMVKFYDTDSITKRRSSEPLGGTGRFPEVRVSYLNGVSKQKALWKVGKVFRHELSHIINEICLNIDPGSENPHILFDKHNVYKNL